MQPIEKIKRADLLLGVVSKLNSFQQQAINDLEKGLRNNVYDIATESSLAKRKQAPEDIVIELISRALELSSDAVDQMYEQDEQREQGFKISEDYTNV
jgi:hypothetical protein